MSIRGALEDAAHRPLMDYEIVAYHGDVKQTKEKALARATTGKDGSYALRTNIARYPLGVNIRVAVLGEKGKELWSSPVHYNTKSELVINATIPDADLGISEYQRLTEAIAPFVQGETLAKLTPTQVAYLSGRSGMAQSKVSVLVTAAGLHTQLPAVSEEIFYGLLRQGSPSSLSGLAATDEERCRATLVTAAHANVIAHVSPRRQAMVVSALHDQKAAAALERTSFISVALKDPRKRKAVAALVARHKGVNDRFWKALANDRGITRADREKLEHYAAVSDIVGDDGDVLSRVEAHLARMGEKVTPRALTRIAPAALSKLVGGAARGHAAVKALAVRFPTQLLQSELASASRSTYFGKYRQSLLAFFDKNPNFDLRTDAHAVLHPTSGADPLQGIANKSEVRAQVGTLARLFRALPESLPQATTTSEPTGLFPNIAALADAGYLSSFGISSTPRGQFVADMAAGSRDAAYWGQVHDRAAAVHDVAMSNAIGLLQAYQQPLGVMQTPAKTSTQPGVADFRTLFGSLDMCECEACTSVISPAAYLADILNYLSTDVAVANTKSPYAVLIERRPDIPHLLLNCDNTNREFRYVDNVNELLEDEVLRRSGTVPMWPPVKQFKTPFVAADMDAAAGGSVTAKTKLAAGLKKVLDFDVNLAASFDATLDVWVVARDANQKTGARWMAFGRGWLLEFSLKKTKVVIDYGSRQTYGTQAELAANPGFRNARATSTLDTGTYPLSLPPSLPTLETRLFLDHLQLSREQLLRLLSPQDTNGWAIEYLGLSDRQATLIADPTAMTPNEAWGFSSPAVTSKDALIDPANSTKPLTGNWAKLLCRVDVLIERAGIRYVDLLDLLGTDFLNAPDGNGNRLVWIASTDKNDPATCDLSKLVINGRPPARLPIGPAPRIVNAGVVVGGLVWRPDDLLDSLIRFLRLRRATGWTTRELDMAIRQLRPLTLDQPTLVLLAILKWAKATLRLTHAEACALLGAIDTTRYIDHAADGQPIVPSQYEQLFQNRAVTNPVDPNFALDAARKQLATTVPLTEGAATIAAAFQIAEDDVTRLAPAGATVTLQTLSDIYRRVLLARGLRVGIADLIALEAMNDGKLPQADQLRTFVDQVQMLRSKLSLAEAAFLVNGADASTAYLAPGDDEIAQALSDVRDAVQKTAVDRRPGAVVISLGSALNLAPTMTTYLLENLPTGLTPGPGAAMMIDAFQTLITSDATKPVDAVAFKELFDDYRRLSRIGLLVQRLNVDPIQLPWLFDSGSKDPWLTVSQLTSVGSTGTAGLASLSALVRLCNVSVQPPYGLSLVDQMFQLAHNTRPLDDVAQLLQENTTWSSVDVTDVCGDLSLSAAADFLSAKALDDLRNAMGALRQLGVGATQAKTLTNAILGDDEASVARNVAKAKHDPDTWLTVMKPINDRLREARRTALVDFLVASPRVDGAGDALWHDADSLYAYLLVDVEMGACMTTSRLRLALSSVQLFVQRCLMNLEAEVSVSDDPNIRARWNEWDTWRKRYASRWAPNREIFLYPEDWLDPELRDDKTAFFQDLENELLQHELTQDRAEEAFAHYLEKLDRVGKLEVMGLFVEENMEEVESLDPSGAVVYQEVRTAGTLHVVGRTSSDPSDWFYRALTTTGEWYQGIWSPWEEIDADVSGDHVLPVVWNGHRYMFWALFEQKADPFAAEQLKQSQQTPDNPLNRWYIRMAWSVYRDGQWSAKRVSKDHLWTPSVEAGKGQISEADFSFKTDVTDVGITIKCYARPVSLAPQKDGYLLQSVPPMSSITFLSEAAPHAWVPNQQIVAFLYQSGVKTGTLLSVVGGLIELWTVPFDPTKDVEVRTLQKLTITSFVKSDGLVVGFPNYQAQVAIDDGPQPTPPEMVRFGQFDFNLCRGDLQPEVVVSFDELSVLEPTLPTQNTTLQGMMYVEKQGNRPFLSNVLYTSPFGPYRVLLPHQTLSLDTTSQPFFFQDDDHAYLVTCPPADSGDGANAYRFDVFYHPFACDFIATLDRYGTDGLLALRTQVSNDDAGETFHQGYTPDPSRVQLSMNDVNEQPVSITREYVDFAISGAYSIYNWELFFHAPLLIATKFAADQQFENARRWFHYIFDPTTRPAAFSAGNTTTPTQRFWNVKPFWEAEGRTIESIDDMLRGAGVMSQQYAAWRQNPFKPFVVARLRPSAFMRAVVMGYVDSHLEWADQQFAQFTMESTNEATLLYVLVDEILGERPETIPPLARPTPQTYLSLQRQAIDDPSDASTAWKNFSDMTVDIEAYVSPAASPSGVGRSAAGTGISSALGRMWAFCIPTNDNLLQYWPRLAGRLFNLRHCRDIDGVTRTIPLWDPIVDPGLLVRAAAAGVDLDSVLVDVNAALPVYRFTVLLQKAVELCAEVRNFGAALLTALEKRDAADLARLRSQQEIDLLTSMKAAKESQVRENTALREAAERSQVTVQARRDYYRDIAYINPAETIGMTLSGVAVSQEVGAGIGDALAAIAALIPQFAGGTSGFYSSPVVVTEEGGQQISRAASASASAARSSASVLSSMAAMSHTIGGFARRWDEWKLQESLADKELDQIEKQIVAATIRETIAQAELDTHNLQTEHAQAVYDRMKSMYTNEELYSWLQGQLSSLYFQSYKLAFDAARKAELAFRYELGLVDSNHIQFGYWDNLKKGLLAGERLQNDLRRMEADYLDLNVREFEITKHISLASLDALALATLKATGTCFVNVPEWVFDLDYPGHYRRRIKSMALSIPCVVGRYTSINCTLTQMSHWFRQNEDLGDADYGDRSGTIFTDQQVIVTSTAREDAGLFELNFHDERRLPFEGTGAVGQWRIDLPRERNQFDVSTVSDVIFHVRYTAREGAQSLQDAATAALPSTGVRMFDVRSDFQAAWYRFKNPEVGRPNEFVVTLGDEHFPFHSADLTVVVAGVALAATLNSTTVSLDLTLDGNPLSFSLGGGPGNVIGTEKSFSPKPASLGELTISAGTQVAAAVTNLVLLCRYELQKSHG